MSCIPSLPWGGASSHPSTSNTFKGHSNGIAWWTHADTQPVLLRKMPERQISKKPASIIFPVSSPSPFSWRSEDSGVSQSRPWEMLLQGACPMELRQSDADGITFLIDNTYDWWLWSSGRRKRCKSWKELVLRHKDRSAEKPVLVSWLGETSAKQLWLVEVQHQPEQQGLFCCTVSPSFLTSMSHEVRKPS